MIDLLKASKNQTKTAQIMRCGFNVVNRIMHLSTKRVMERRNYIELVSAQLSIDEKAFKNGHNYVTVLSHPGSGCVLDVEEHRTKEACKSSFNRILTETQLGQVTTISMDIRHGAQVLPAYIDTAEELLPNAAITHDRFHLIMYVNKAIDQVRRREVKRHDELKNTRYALLKNLENLTEKQRIKFESIIGANYEVSHIGIRLPGKESSKSKSDSPGFLVHYFQVGLKQLFSKNIFLLKFFLYIDSVFSKE